MTRINTNISSLVAQKTLARNNSQLQQALTRLSTGLRINVGKDDPAGLIASEVLRSDIISVQKAIVNSERANQLIGTADSGLGQVSSLLNDIRGLVSEAANIGALSDEQVAANQLQIDSSLEAIDRIAQVTAFQGKRLLDGTLDFLTSGVDLNTIRDLQVDQASFGTQTTIGVTLDIVSQATRGQLNFAFGAIGSAAVLQIGGARGTEAFNFAAGSTIENIATAVNLVSDATGVQAEVEQAATAGSITVSSFGTNNDILLTADQAGEDAGNVRVKYSAGDSTATTVTYTAGTGGDPSTLDVKLQTRAYVAASAVVDDTDIAQDAVYNLYIAGANNDLVLTANADTGTSLSGVTVNINNAAAPAASTYTAATKVLSIGTNGVANAAALAAAVNATLNGFGFQVALAATDVTSGTNDGTGALATETGVQFEATQGIGDANNALRFTAKVKGAQFNNVAVNYVNDDLLLASAGLTAGNEIITYNSDAQKASAALVFSGAQNDIRIEAATAGKAYNNVQVLLTDSGVLAGDTATAAYDATAKTLTIDINGGTTTRQTIIDAIDDEGTFVAAEDATGGDAAGSAAVAATNTTVRGGRVGNTGNSGGDAGTLYVRIQDGFTTAANIITRFGALANARAAELFEVESTVDNDGTGQVSAHAYLNAFTGGVTGGDVIATSEDVVDAINGDATAAAALTAALNSTDNGTGVASLFQEFAYSGSAATNNRLQFLGPENSRDIRFTAIAGQSLGIDLSTDPQVTARSSATLTATNANASLVFSAVTEGDEYDDVQVRFHAVTTGSQEGVVFDGEESKAEADLRFTNANTGIRITANERGVDFNDVNVVLEATLGAAADPTATYDVATKTLTLSVRTAGTTTANELITAINDEATGAFTAELNYAGDATNSGAGLILAADASTTFADTGSTGGHRGTLTFNVLNGATAAQVATLLANDTYANKYFFANQFGSSTGAGAINFFEDSNQAVTAGGIASEGTLIVNLATSADGVVTTTANDLIAFFNNPANSATLSPLGISVSNAEGSDGTGRLAATTTDLQFATTGTEQTNAQSSLTTSAVNGTSASVTLTAVTAGAAYDGVQLVFENNPLLTGGGDETINYNSTTKVLTVGIRNGVTTAQHVVDAINLPANGLNALFTADLGGTTGTGFVTTFDTGTTSGGVVETGTATGAALLGNSDLANTGLTFRSIEFGSDAFVSVKALSGTFALTDSTGAASERNTGTDVNARVNGIQAIGKGLQASINTSSLDLSFFVDSSVADDTTTTFEITGGGAQFQLGPEVVSNQQARLGIRSVSTATLGGVSGKLFELRSGGTRSLANDTGGAARIIEEVITQVTGLRGRLGAFQKTTLETNIFTLNDTLENLTDAESSIRDADFAAESARLTRAQILVQSSTSVLAIANQNPQNVLALLR